MGIKLKCGYMVMGPGWGQGEAWRKHRNTWNCGHVGGGCHIVTITSGAMVRVGAWSALKGAWSRSVAVVHGCWTGWDDGSLDELQGALGIRVGAEVLAGECDRTVGGA